MSWIIRRDPATELRSLQEDLNRFFNTSVPRLLGAEEGLLRGSWSPAVDIYEDQDAIMLEADLPGMKPGDFELSVENYTLTLRGERKLEKRTEGDYHRVERSYGSFTRTFTLPSTVNVEQVHAEFKDGVLRVSLPKREEVKPRQIQVAVKTEADGSKGKTAEAKSSAGVSR
jgi:HSP20 family protein